MSKRPIERIAVVVSIVSFGGSIVFGAISTVNSTLNQPIQNQTASAATTPSQNQLRQSQFKAQEYEYEVVLKQEPENQIALEGLVGVRLQMKDTKGAIKPLEKLSKLYPNQQQYKTLLAQLNKEKGRGDRTGK